jgi:glycine/D-amino acid oxidase-like deaminating enzyme
VFSKAYSLKHKRAKNLKKITTIRYYLKIILKYKEEYKRLRTIGKVFGIDSFVLSREETKQLYPLMNVSDIFGSFYSPRQVPTFAS